MESLTYRNKNIPAIEGAQVLSFLWLQNPCFPSYLSNIKFDLDAILITKSSIINLKQHQYSEGKFRHSFRTGLRSCRRRFGLNWHFDDGRQTVGGRDSVYLFSEITYGYPHFLDELAKNLFTRIRYVDCRINNHSYTNKNNNLRLVYFYLKTTTPIV